MSPRSLTARRALLHDDEVARAGRFRSERLRQHFVLCRGALREILGHYTGRDPRDLLFHQGRYGKPMLAHTHLEADRLQFNVTHSENLALLAVTLDSVVGVDVERVRPLPDADRLAERFFAPREYDQYRAHPVRERPLAFFTCWTRKEAFIKALGEGLSHPLHRFEVTLDPAGPARICEPGGTLLSGWSLHGFAPAEEYCAAVAVRHAAAALDCFELS